MDEIALFKRMEKMGSLDGYTDPPPRDLLKAIEEHRCILLAGSGVSQRCLSRTREPLPGWRKLLDGLLEWSMSSKILDASVSVDLKQLLDRREFLMVAEELLEQIGQEQFSQYINEVFDPKGIVPSFGHELLVAIPFRGIMTTNYDNLFERAYLTVHKQLTERVRSDEISRIPQLLKESQFIFKLHGDLSKADSIILGHRHFVNLLLNPAYNRILDDLFTKNSVLMAGYSLNDPDITFVLDRLSIRNKKRRNRHFILAVRGERNATERKRLLKDRNVKTIEYYDAFGHHNHLDTFLERILFSLGLGDQLRLMRPRTHARIMVNYPEHLSVDGRFVWKFLFREGAVTRSEGAQEDQIAKLEESLNDNLRACDYVVFVADAPSFDTESPFLRLIERTRQVAGKVGVQVIFLPVGTQKRPRYLAREASSYPTFYLEKGFSEKDLLEVSTFIAQDLRAGRRQD